MKAKGLRKTIPFFIAMAAAVSVCVYGGMKLSNSFPAQNEKSARNESLIRNVQPYIDQELFIAPNAILMPESAEFIEAGKKMGELYRDKENTVVAIVNGKYEITNSDVEMGLLLHEAFNNASNYDMRSSGELSEELRQEALTGSTNRAKEEMLQELIKNCVLVDEADKRGIVATQAQARAYIDEQYGLAEKALSQASKKERTHALKMRTLLNALVVGTGLSNEEYLWEIQVPGIVHQLMIEQLYKMFVEGLSEEVRYDKERVKAKYEAFEKKLMDAADIRQFDLRTDD